jgi:hypothetical protein
MDLGYSKLGRSRNGFQTLELRAPDKSAGQPQATETGSQRQVFSVGQTFQSARFE